MVMAQAPAPGNGNYALNGQMMAGAGPASPSHSYAPLAHPDGWTPDSSNCCDEADGRSPYQFYASAEFLLWNFRNNSLPSIATSVPVGLLQVNNQDQIAVAGGSIPFGPARTFLVPVGVVSNPSFNRDLDPGDQRGGRVTLGYWCDSAQQVGFEVSGLYIHPNVTNFIATSGTAANPFTIDTGVRTRIFSLMGGIPVQIDSANLAVARQATALTVGDFRSQLIGAEANVRCLGCSIGAVSFGGLAGARFLEFREGLNVINNVSLTQVPGVSDGTATGFPPIVNFGTFDSLTTRNRYYAAQIGVEAEIENCGVFFNARGKVALGGMQQIVDVFGGTNIIGTNTPGSFRGGLLSDPLNQGTRERTRVAVIPEINLKLGYEFNGWLRTYVGYDFLYLQHVLRPGNVTDTETINTQVTVTGTTQTINVTQPVIRLRDQDVWVQGVNFGLEFRY